MTGETDGQRRHNRKYEVQLCREHSEKSISVSIYFDIFLGIEKVALLIYFE
jgi:hypothetical protein